MDERLSAALHGGARTWRLALDKRLKHLGIGQSGWMTIAMVAKSAEPLSQRALADLVGVEGPSMVSMLDRLERGGFLTRAPSAHDRRVKLVQLTEADLEKLGVVLGHRKRLLKAIATLASPAALEQATSVGQARRRRRPVVPPHKPAMPC